MTSYVCGLGLGENNILVPAVLIDDSTIVVDSNIDYVESYAVSKLDYKPIEYGSDTMELLSNIMVQYGGLVKLITLINPSTVKGCTDEFAFSAILQTDNKDTTLHEVTFSKKQVDVSILKSNVFSNMESGDDLDYVRTKAVVEAWRDGMTLSEDEDLD